MRLTADDGARRRAFKALRSAATALLLVSLLGCETGSDEPVTITTASLPVLHLFEDYRVELQAAGGRAPYSWSADDLPYGLVLDGTTGLVTRHQSEANVHDLTSTNVSFTVVDQRGRGDLVTLRLDFVGISSLAVGGVHNCALDAVGATWCWGRNLYGQLGIGSPVDQSTPVRVAGGHRFTRLSLSNFATCALDEEGAAWCWGRGVEGQLGDGTSTNRSEPTQVAGGHRFSAIAMGAFHVCAIDTSGGTLCWGRGIGGALGDGTSQDSDVPVWVATSQEFVAVTAGDAHTCALDVAGLAYCWGRNTYGQLGTGNTNDRAEPAAVDGGAFLAIAAGENHTCGLGVSSGGRAWCWGRGHVGQLGNADTSGAPAHSPVGVAGSAQLYADIAAGSNHTCVLRESGEARCWGANDGRQLGAGLTVSRAYSPANVALGEAVAGIGGGVRHSCALGRTGIVWCWGTNDMGQLGDGSRLTRPLPSRVGARREQ